MKRIFIMMLLCLMAVGSLTAKAVTSIDPEQPSSITIQYRYENMNFAGLTCQIYRVAEVSSDGTYVLTGEFAGYPVSIYDVESQAEWKNITSTLSAYVVADGIQPDYTLVTDEKGTASFQNILPGMYLTQSVTVQDSERILTFEAFLTVVPYPQEDGSHNYDVTVVPKVRHHTPTPKPLEYKVVKQWKDLGNTQQRPQSVTVDILKDGVVQSTQILSADSDWCYSWTAPDDGSLWQAVERSIPQNFTVTVVSRDNTILITNVYEVEQEPPKTGETTVLWPYMLLLCFSGGVLILLALWRMRKEQ